MFNNTRACRRWIYPVYMQVRVPGSSFQFNFFSCTVGCFYLWSPSLFSGYGYKFIFFISIWIICLHYLVFVPSNYISFNGSGIVKDSVYISDVFFSDPGQFWVSSRRLVVARVFVLISYLFYYIFLIQLRLADFYGYFADRSVFVWVVLDLWFLGT